MVTRSIVFAEGEHYHVYNRGTDKRVIFNDKHDYKRFIELLYVANSYEPINIRNLYRDHNSVFDFKRGDAIVAIGAYCLMPNHFHILVTPLIEGGLAIFMNKLSTGYSMYFNKKYDRSGALFQGRYKASHVADDVYLKYLYSYVHLNPVKLIQPDWKDVGINNFEKALDFSSNYTYSSFRDYLGEVRKESKILTSEYFPEFFDDVKGHEKEISEWLSFNQGQP